MVAIISEQNTSNSHRHHIPGNGQETISEQEKEQVHSWSPDHEPHYYFILRFAAKYQAIASKFTEIKLL